MQEAQVTVEGERFLLGPPFLVIATQNPIDLEGTYPLPEAQLDRFLHARRASAIRPSEEEREILERRREARRGRGTRARAIVSRDEFLAMQRALEDVFVAEAIEEYIVELAQATRADPRVALGASPRGTLALFKLARARAALARRGFVTPDDVKDMAVPALAHRIILRPELWVSKVSPVQVVEDLLVRVPTPRARRRRRLTSGATHARRALDADAGGAGAPARGRRRVAPSCSWSACRWRSGCSPSRGGRRTPRYTLAHELSSARLLEGERLTVIGDAHGGDRAVAGGGLRAAAGVRPARCPAARARVVSLRAGETERWSYELQLPGARAPCGLGIVHLRFWDAVGPRVTEIEHRDPKTLASIRATCRYEPAARRRCGRRPRCGNYVSPLVGDGHRAGRDPAVRPGRSRPPRELARLASAPGRLFVTRYQQERNADVVLMLDTLSRVGASARHHAATRACAPPRRWPRRYLARKDRVGLIEYGGVLRWVRPGSGRPHFERLLDTLAPRRGDVHLRGQGPRAGAAPRPAARRRS